MPGLIAVGRNKQAESKAALRDFTTMQDARHREADVYRDQEKAEAMSGTGMGLSIGMMTGGPVGAAVGAGIGYLATKLF